MAKQRILDFENDTDLDNDLDTELEVGFDEDLDEIEERPAEKEHALSEEAETPARTPMTPEAALEHLLTLGRTQGYVSYDDVLSVLPEAENNMEQIEDIFASLFEQGIEVGQTREEEPDDLPELDSEVVEEDGFDLSQIEIDDSISLYLKDWACTTFNRRGRSGSGQAHGKRP
jgi:RNA polymerase primary sigma factor